MNPDRLEYLLSVSRPAPLPERIRGAVLAAARERALRRRDAIRFAGLAAAATLLWALVLGLARNDGSDCGLSQAAPFQKTASIPRIPNLPLELRQRLAAVVAAPSRAAELPPRDIPLFLLPPGLRDTLPRYLP